jgi:hypothetical protein
MQTHQKLQPNKMAGLQALIDFLEKYKSLWDCSVVEIFNEQLWQTVPGDWLLALRDSAATDLLRIPTGHVQASPCVFVNLW